MNVVVWSMRLSWRVCICPAVYHVTTQTCGPIEALEALGATVQSTSHNTFSLCVSHLHVSCAEHLSSRGLVTFFFDATRSCLGKRSRWQIAVAATRWRDCIMSRDVFPLEDHCRRHLEHNLSIIWGRMCTRVRLKRTRWNWALQGHWRDSSEIRERCGLLSLSRSRLPLAAAIQISLKMWRPNCTRTVESTCCAVQVVWSVPTRSWFSVHRSLQMSTSPLGVPCLSPLQATLCDPLSSLELCVAIDETRVSLPAPQFFFFESLFVIFTLFPVVESLRSRVSRRSRTCRIWR